MLSKITSSIFTDGFEDYNKFRYLIPCKVRTVSSPKKTAQPRVTTL